MTHPDEEVLAQFGLEDPLAVDAATLVHISDCDQCSRRIQQIQRAVDAVLAAGGRPDLRTLTAPSASVRERMLARVGERPPPARHAAARPSTPDQTASPVATSPHEQAWLFGQPGQDEAVPWTERAEPGANARSGAFWRIAAAAIAGVVVGAGVAWWAAAGDQTDDSASADADVTTSDLVPVDGHHTSGVISLSQEETSPRITITLDRLDSGKGFVEAWLVDEPDDRMVALGVLDGKRGTFIVPAVLNLTKYAVVDVSREQFDGDPAHAPLSLARGPVPPQ